MRECKSRIKRESENEGERMRRAGVPKQDLSEYQVLGAKISIHTHTYTRGKEQCALRGR